jgi:hypothetical protein
MNFKLFKQSVQKQLETMQQGQLFTTSVDGDTLWNTYLDSFPEGTNNIYRVRREHDCSADRSFIRNIGGVVAEVNGEIVSIWDLSDLEYGYQQVANTLSALVKSSQLEGIYKNFQANVGIDKAYEELETGEVKTWENFFVKLNTQHFCRKDQIDSIKGAVKTNKQVLERSLSEITEDAVDTVLELIAQNSLYRGSEFKSTVVLVKDLKEQLKTVKNKDVFLFNKAVQLGGNCSLRNTVIGTLLVDISEGVELDVAVKKFEDKTAPTNYKRPTALVTPKMIDAAEKKVIELGIESALYRRYAVLEDITINNVLWADRSTEQALGVFGELKKSAKVTTPNFDKIESVSMETFINSILPTAESVELFVENKHTNNFVSLVAPVNADAPNILKWGNNFSWSYNGEVTDSIKERVKAAGGNVTGDVCCRLAWDYTDDLDFHMHEPNGGHIYFSTRGRKSPNGGMLDVDANGGSGMMKEPVENIFYENFKTMRDGVYSLEVNNWNRRSSDGVGFTVEIEALGDLYTLDYDKVVRTGETVKIATLKVKNGELSVEGNVESKNKSKQIWNVSTCNFHKVDAIMFSPNHWDGEETGNKHVFFMLDGCVNTEQTRGFYNEFLKQELNEHRKVFEMLGGKLKTPKSDKQLSGLGFSTTKKDEIVVKVTGSFSRIIKIVM